MMFVAGFGWAKPVPVDPRYFKKPKQGMALTALAGPVSNLVLAVAAMLISKAIYLYAPYSVVMDVVFSFLLYTLAPLSIGLGLFNLIPIPPWTAPRSWQRFCGPAVHHADAVRAVRHPGAAGAVLCGHRQQPDLPGHPGGVRRAAVPDLCLR